MGLPRRILVASAGTRGDIQPYIAIADALQQAGYDVLLASCVNHEQFVKECGVAFHGLFIDSEKAHREDPVVRKAMADGDAPTFIKALNGVMREHGEFHLLEWMKIVKEFQPDLILVGTIADYYGLLARYKLRIPTLDVKMQYINVKPHRMIWGFPDLPCGLNGWVVRNVFLGDFYKGFQKDCDPWTEKHHGYRLCDSYSWDMFLADATDCEISPAIICQASRFADVMFPQRPANVKVVGQCVMDSDRQVCLANDSAASSFGDEVTLAKVEAFIAAGDKPIFMGWGSMCCKSPEYMVELVIRAAKHSALRAIIQGGWAKLSMETLQRATADKALIEYAVGNVLFVEQAPHEWLFRRCACTVHHGGAGTLSAAVRAGVPTVVTPVFMDQHDHAYLVNQLGVGIGFKKQFQRITAQELGDAIRRVVSSAEMAAQARIASEEVRAEDGAAAVAGMVEQFWSEYVESGVLEASVNDRLQRKPVSCFGRLGGVCAGICGGRRE